jgi:prevent-host-death family protein
MKTVSSTDVKNTFGTVMDSALVEPVMVKKSGRSSVVILSVTEYERLTAIEDAYWASRALKAKASGFASADEVQQLLKDSEGA